MTDVEQKPDNTDDVWCVVCESWWPLESAHGRSASMIGTNA